MSDDADPAGPGQEPARAGAFQIGGAVILPQSTKGEAREASVIVHMGDKYADFHMIDDETHRTRLVVLMPVAEAVKLATAILEKAGRSTP
jgi:hypothetical protein